jgi:hypothetical protein
MNLNESQRSFDGSAYTLNALDSLKVHRPLQHSMSPQERRDVAAATA